MAILLKFPKKSFVKCLRLKSSIFAVALIFFGLSSSFGATAFSASSIIFSEIMYDAEGGDTKHEWVEIQNTSSEPVALFGYKFREGGTNHSLTIAQGTTTIAGRAFAIIADDPAIFLETHPEFLGTIFKSSFSLSNTGETLSLKDSRLSDVSSVTYSTSAGAAGDGQSLQLIDGVWKTGNPTPGKINVYTPPPLKETPQSSTSKNSSSKTKTTGSKTLSSGKLAAVLAKPLPQQENTETINLSSFSPKETSSNMYIWYAALGGLILFALGIVVTLRLKQKSKTGYEIVE